MHSVGIDTPGMAKGQALASELKMLRLNMIFQSFEVHNTLSEIQLFKENSCHTCHMSSQNVQKFYRISCALCAWEAMSFSVCNSVLAFCLEMTNCVDLCCFPNNLKMMSANAAFPKVLKVQHSSYV